MYTHVSTYRKDKEMNQVMKLGKLSHGGAFTARDDEGGDTRQLLRLPYFYSLHSKPPQRCPIKFHNPCSTKQPVASIHLQKIHRLRIQKYTCYVFVKRSL